LNTPREGSDLFNVESDKYNYYRINIDAFAKVEDAQKQAEKMKLDKIRSHQKSITKLEKLKFN
jgi:hypothetical protein